MMYRTIMLRAVLYVSVLGAMALAGCGGGGNKSVLPTGATTTQTQSPSQAPQNYLTFTVPSKATGGQSSLALGRAKPQYIDTTTQNSAIVASVTPTDPAEAAEFGTFTVCYNLYTNGSLNGGASGNYITTPAVGGAGVVATAVQIAIPSPPGLDGFQITQYAGQCVSGNPYALPTLTAGATSPGILSQTPVEYASLTPGTTGQNINTLIGACFPQPAAPVTASSTCGVAGGGPTALTGVAPVASIAFGVLPITGPVREVNAFTAAAGENGHIGVPIPLEGLSAALNVMPGLVTGTGGPPYTAVTVSAGLVASGITVTRTENSSVGGPHTQLWVVDAKTGAIAQMSGANGNPSGAVVVHELNALIGGGAANATVPGGDITYTGAGAATNTSLGDPYVILLVYDGSGQAALGSVSVTASATIGGTLQTVSLSPNITPQSAVFTAGGTGYVDATAPAANTKGVLLGSLAGTSVLYTTAAANVNIDGSPGTTLGVTGFSAAPTALGEITYAPWIGTSVPYLYTVDTAQTGAAAGTGACVSVCNSGLWDVTPNLGSSNAVTVQNGGQYFAFNKPGGVVYAPVGTGNFLFVADASNSIYKVDISQTVPGTPDLDPCGAGMCQTSTNTGAIAITPAGALNFGSASYIGMLYDASVKSSGVSTGTMLVADVGNNRIARVDLETGAVSTLATVTAPAGLTMNGTTVYASSQGGQIYAIADSSGTSTAVSLGLSTSATVTDGPVGQLVVAPTTTPTLVAANYALQGQAASVFSTTIPAANITLPYTLAPFNGTQIFNVNLLNNPGVAPLQLAPDTSSGATTGAGLVHADGGIVYTGTLTGAPATSLTPNAFEFANSGKLRTLVP